MSNIQEIDGVFVNLDNVKDIYPDKFDNGYIIVFYFSTSRAWLPLSQRLTYDRDVLKCKSKNLQCYKINSSMQ